MVADLVVDGVPLADVSPTAWHWVRVGAVAAGERRWVSTAEARGLLAEGWSRVGRAPDTDAVLVWRPLPARPAERGASASQVVLDEVDLVDWPVSPLTSADVARWFDVPADLVEPRPKREVRWFTCARCGGSIPDYLAFGVGGGGGPSRVHYCLHHVPRWVWLRMWLRGLVRRG